MAYLEASAYVGKQEAVPPYSPYAALFEYLRIKGGLPSPTLLLRVTDPNVASILQLMKRAGVDLMGGSCNDLLSIRDTELHSIRRAPAPGAKLRITSNTLEAAAACFKLCPTVLEDIRFQSPVVAEPGTLGDNFERYANALGVNRMGPEGKLQPDAAAVEELPIDGVLGLQTVRLILEPGPIVPAYLLQVLHNRKAMEAFEGMLEKLMGLGEVDLCVNMATYDSTKPIDMTPDVALLLVALYQHTAGIRVRFADGAVRELPLNHADTAENIDLSAVSLYVNDFSCGSDNPHPNVSEKAFTDAAIPGVDIGGVQYPFLRVWMKCASVPAISELLRRREVQEALALLFTGTWCAELVEVRVGDDLSPQVACVTPYDIHALVKALREFDPCCVPDNSGNPTARSRINRHNLETVLHDLVRRGIVSLQLGVDYHRDLKHLARSSDFTETVLEWAFGVDRYSWISYSITLGLSHEPALPTQAVDLVRFYVFDNSGALLGAPSAAKRRLSAGFTDNRDPKRLRHAELAQIMCQERLTAAEAELRQARANLEAVSSALDEIRAQSSAASL